MSGIRHPHIGSSFDSFLEEEGLNAETTRAARERVQAWVGGPAVHPGEILAEELELAGGSAVRLAREIGVPPDTIRRLLTGQVDVTPDLALRLAGRFGSSAAFWLKLQAAFDRKRIEGDLRQP